MKKRILSIMLALCMVIMLMPQAAFAETYGDFDYSVSGGKSTITSYNGSDEVVTIPDTLGGYPVKAIGDKAFSHNISIKKVVIQDGVTSIGINAFNYCSSLESINIPDGVTSIGRYAFRGCSSLESINIPDSVTSIGKYAFNDCTTLKSINIPDGVTSIENSVFRGCSSLENVTIPEGVISIGNSAFGYCTSLESIIIPHKVTVINNYTFSGCNNLESIFLSDNVTSIGVAAIPDTASQIRYSLDETNGEVTITKIELADGKENIDIPEKIFGYPVAAVATSEQSKVGAHTCKGGTATCTKKAECALCGKEYGELADHTFTAETINEDTLKTAGTCTTEAVYYYSCSVCGEVEFDDNHTFTGEKDPDNHTGKLKWTQTATQHKQYYDCCDKITVAAEDHDWENGECSKCDYVCNHSGGTPTCTEKAVCEVCGEEYGILDPDNHTGEQIWVQTATQHEKKWNCCDEITVAAEDHSWENGVCAECDYVCEHSYEWQNEDGKYWKKCSVCGIETAKTDLPELTIDAPDTVCRTQDCEISVLLPDNIIDAQLAFEFKGLDGTLSSAIEDGRISGVIFAREYPAAEYSFLVTITAEMDDGYVLTVRKTVNIQSEHSGGEATCTEKAVCEVCGEEYGELDPDNHTGELTWTQTEKQHEQKWDCCDEITVSAEAHDWKNGVCAECDYVCEHSYEWQSDDSKYWQKCSVCGDETAKKDLPELTIDAPDKVCRTQDCEISVLLPDNIIDAQLAFEFKGLGGGLKAEVKDGRISGVITADGYVSDENSFVVKIIVEMDDGYVLTESKTVEIQNEHSGGKATCTKKAVCEVCGEEYGELDSTNHDLEHVPAKAATTSETGNKEYWRCKNCGKYFSDKDGKNEITLKDVEIAKLTPESKPQNTSSASTTVKSDESPSTGGSVGTAIMLVSGVTILAAWAFGKRKKAQTK